MHQASKIVKVNAGATTIYARVTSLGGGEEYDVSSGVFSFDQIAESVEAIATSISKVMEKIKPDKACVEFGLELAAEPGKLVAILVNGAATANIKVALEWSGKQTPRG